MNRVHQALAPLTRGLEWFKERPILALALLGIELNIVLWIFTGFPFA